jgi:hypothetical protein
MAQRRTAPTKYPCGAILTHGGIMIDWNKRERSKRMTKTTTETAECTFETKEHADGTPWIFVNIHKPGLPTIADAFIGFSLSKGVTLREADDLAKVLRNKIDGISITK